MRDPAAGLGVMLVGKGGAADVSVLKTALVWMRVSIGIIRDDSETYSPYAFSPLP